MAKLILPELGEGIEQAIVSYWHFKEGDKVEEGEDIVEMATDKATFNLPAPSSGVLTKIYFEEGENVTVGGIIAEINEEES
jgi:pyruvate/2-oxoglutarate dehydrogenase complex dihydrolipoamide acyltransferase (E2) component